MNEMGECPKVVSRGCRRAGAPRDEQGQPWNELPCKEGTLTKRGVLFRSTLRERLRNVGAILSAAPGYTLSPMRSAVSTRVASPAMMAESTPCAFIPVALCNCARCKHTCLCRAQWPAARCSSRTLRASGAASGRTTVAAMLPVKHPCLGGVNGLAHNAQQRQERPRAAARLGQPDLIGLCTATWTHACMRR